MNVLIIKIFSLTLNTYLYSLFLFWFEASLCFFRSWRSEMVFQLHISCPTVFLGIAGKSWLSVELTIIFSHRDLWTRLSFFPVCRTGDILCWPLLKRLHCCWASRMCAPLHILPVQTLGPTFHCVKRGSRDGSPCFVMGLQINKGRVIKIGM